MSENLAKQLKILGKQARKAAQKLALVSSEQKVAGLMAMANHIRASAPFIIEANQEDVEKAEAKGISPAMLDRLSLDDGRIEAIAQSLESIAKMADPVGIIEKEWEQPNGLKFSKVKIPIGVIGMIYESRPNVTADAGALCLKSGNACILRGGSESIRSNKAIHLALIAGLKEADLPETAIQLIQTTDRAAVSLLLGGLDENVDMIIPRGGKGLIARVQNDARVPVLAHLEGLCHSYVHKDADQDKAREVVLNAKMRRTGICGSTETLLVDSAIASDFLPNITAALAQLSCEMRGCQTSQTLSTLIKPATEQDFYTEHLAPIINIKVLDDLQAAINHINAYGSGHTDSILTRNNDAASQFQREVDSAIVMHNASTQFADGGEFGFGAEIGISTGRLHARGPVGAEHLTTFKYLVNGKNHVRPS